jgi:hypothetical protein
MRWRWRLSTFTLASVAGSRSDLAAVRLVVLRLFMKDGKVAQRTWVPLPSRGQSCAPNAVSASFMRTPSGRPASHPWSARRSRSSGPPSARCATSTAWPLRRFARPRARSASSSSGLSSAASSKPTRANATGLGRTVIPPPRVEGTSMRVVCRRIDTVVAHLWRSRSAGDQIGCGPRSTRFQNEFAEVKMRRIAPDRPRSSPTDH